MYPTALSSGPFLSIINLLPLCSIFQYFGHDFQCYADDTQKNFLVLSVHCLSTQCVHTLISSFIGCCNSFLFHVPHKSTHKLQLLKNSAAHYSQNLLHSPQITPVLQQLHWLRVKFRIISKLFCLLFKEIYNVTSLYLCDLVRIVTSSCCLRSSSSFLLSVLFCSLSTMESFQSLFSPTLELLTIRYQRWHRLSLYVKIKTQYSPLFKVLCPLLFHPRMYDCNVTVMWKSGNDIITLKRWHCLFRVRNQKKNVCICICMYVFGFL